MTLLDPGYLVPHPTDIRLAEGKVKISNVALPVGIMLTNVVSGSMILIRRVSDGVVIHKGVLIGTVLSIVTKLAGNATVNIRNATTAPFYTPFDAQIYIDPKVGANLIVSQVLN